MALVGSTSIRNALDRKRCGHYDRFRWLGHKTAARSQKNLRTVAPGARHPAAQRVTFAPVTAKPRRRDSISFEWALPARSPVPEISVRCESRGLRNRSVHCNRSRIVRTRVRTAPSASPAGETIPVSRRGTDRDTSSAFSPSTAGRTVPPVPCVVVR